MPHLVSFPLADGSTIAVEVQDGPPAGTTLRGVAPAEMVERAGDTFESALATIRPAAEAIISKLRDLSERPDTIEVEFGLKLSASAGAIIAAAATEANFKINLVWKRRGPTEV
jgi:hypothetical protein